ncbi:hypothetical protein GCM10009801_02650 [Streptomyces albiaxialis]|uniref:Secreted protein n=1 Tax=Streptomyces albiaxialis TaxID=329523 RepID=A0ABN2VF53_9ACTN
MSRTVRGWAWIGGVWLAMCVAGGGATLALQPDDPSSGESRDGAPSRPPAPRLAEEDDECADEEAAARREAQRKGHEKYAVLCVMGPEGSLRPMPPRASDGARVG